MPHNQRRGHGGLQRPRHPTRNSPACAGMTDQAMTLLGWSRNFPSLCGVVPVILPGADPHHRRITQKGPARRRRGCSAVAAGCEFQAPSSPAQAGLFLPHELLEQVYEVVHTQAELFRRLECPLVECRRPRAGEACPLGQPRDRRTKGSPPRRRDCPQPQRAYAALAENLIRPVRPCNQHQLRRRIRSGTSTAG